jgi:(1->4)-alpha-D-glucan 1-alpha-D-glucosylmutase
VPPVVPIATYRLQLSRDFGFDDAARLAPYLKALGISHLYASPFLKARAGSRHGYDIVDHRALNPEFGGDAAFARLSNALRDADIGLILDFVPNHMAVGRADNAWWLDVLEWGQASPHARSFDISWELLPYRRGGGVLLPVLGKPYGEALNSGEIELRYDARKGSFSAWYFDHRFPINPQRYSDMLRTMVAAASAEAEPAGRELLALADAYRRPGAPSYAEAPALKRRLIEIESAAAIIERGLAAYRADHDAGRQALHRLLERQHYRLASWRVAVSGINYRRFFDINDLAGVRVEHPRTFRVMHELVARLIAADELQGLRLDHIDGLIDPLQYSRRLQQMIRQVRGPARRRFYVVVEKILADGEPMPRFTGVAGTTGYEWLNLISRVLVDEAGRQRLNEFWSRIAPEQGDFERVLESAKQRVLDTIMASEFAVLVQLLTRIAAGHYTTRDYTGDRLREALTLYVLKFPYYRTYVTVSGCRDEDRSVINRTIAAARRRWHGSDTEIFDFLRDALTLDLARNGLPYSRSRLRAFALKFQQFTGPMMAKSLEDTALYRYHSLLALNDVGGDPARPALSAADFHDRMGRRAKEFPHSLTATATHDTKRGEDARMRILALSELSELWMENVVEWRRLNARLVTAVPSGRSPSLGHEYMLYQALVGAWPGEVDRTLVERMEGYALKAAREGKLETSWINPDEEYEHHLCAFVRAILDRGQSAEFLDSFSAFAARTALIGAVTSLSQVVLKATMPGVPDFYQGAEFWDLSLVDPDNRRPVDFAARAAALAALDETPPWPELAKQWPDGRIKLALIRGLLRLRQELPGLFRDGTYQPVEVTGPDRDHVLAFMRSHRRDRILVVVGRHFGRMMDAGSRWPCGWQAALQVERKVWLGLRDALESFGAVAEALEVAHLFRVLPVAILRSP